MVSARRAEYPNNPGGKLWAASRDGELEDVRKLIADGADPNAHASSTTGSTALHEGLLAGHREAVDALLAAGARVSIADAYGNTPLHACAASAAGDDPELTARLLASVGCDPAAKNADGATALHLAALRGKPAMARMLVDRGAPLHAVDRKGRDALSFAADAPTERVLLELIGREVLQAEATDPAPVWPSSTPWYLSGTAKKEGDAKEEPLRPPPRALAPPPPPPPPPLYKGKGKKGARPASAPRYGERRGAYGAHGSDSEQDGALAVAATLQERLVSKRELYRVLRAAGVTDLASDEGLRLFHEADVDGDGKLSFEEFARVARKFRPLLTHPAAQAGPRAGLAAVSPAGAMAKGTRAKLRRAFVAFDADGSGNISLPELAAAFRQCGIFVPDPKLRTMFAEADVDGSGAIDLPEFEALARRLLAPPKPNKAPPGAPKPGAGSATAKVFAALERGGTGRLATAELPHALRLLGIDAAEPEAERLVRAAAEGSGGAMDEQAFTDLVHALLASADGAEERGEKGGGLRRGGAKKGGAAGAAAKKGGGAIAALAARGRAGEEAEAKRAAAAEAEQVHARLAQAFALAESHESGTVSAAEVGALLWRAGVVADAQLLAALRPAPAHQARRISFDALLRLAAQAADGTLLSAALLHPPPAAAAAAGKAAAGAGAGAGAAPNALLLTVQRAVLSPWLVELQAVQALFVVVRGELAPTGGGGGRAPLMLRSPTQRKRGASLEVGLSAMLAGGAGLVEIELLHEPLAAGAAHLLGTAQLELGRLYQTAADKPLQYELPLYDARATHAATLHLLAQPHTAFAPPAAPAAAPAAAALAPAAPSTAAQLAQVHALEVQLAQVRQRADALAQENARLVRHQARLPIGMAQPGAPSHKRHEVTDWRKQEVLALEASLTRLNRRRGEYAKQTVPVLERTRAEIAAMVEVERSERAASEAAREAGATPAV